MAWTTTIILGKAITCYGGSDGIVCAGFTGGVPTNPVFLWTLPDASHLTTPCVYGALAGAYSLTVVSDDQGLTSATNNPYTLTQPSQISASFVVTNVTCNGGATGTIVTTVSNGTAPYTYSWTLASNPRWGRTTKDLSGLLPGVYSLTITDTNGCSRSGLTATVAEGTAISPTPTLLNANACYGDCTSRITLNPTDGVHVLPANYTYVWTGSGTGESNVRSNICAGATVSVVITCIATGCTTTYSHTFPAFTKTTIRTIQVTSPTIDKPTSGAIKVNIVGGTAPYTYHWNTTPVKTTKDISGLSEGTYTLIVTDTNSCTATQAFTLNNGCTNFDFSQFKVFLMKTQCCLATKIRRYNKLVLIGREDLADCLLLDLMLLRMIYDRLKCLESVSADTCWECSDIEDLMNTAKELCECDCCEEDQEIMVYVRYNSDTKLFDYLPQSET